jgi:hypothetical protein
LSDKPEILVDYQHLLYLEKSGVENFIPEGCYFSVPVKILLDGIEPEEERRRKALPESKYAWPMGGFMRDQYIIGQAGSVGPGSQSQGMQFQQVWNEIQPHTDLEVLAQDLEKLKKRLQGEAETPDQLQAVTDVALAAQEAKVGNGPKILEYLKKGGVWVLKKAEDIGTKVAVEVIKKAMGL